MSVVNQMLRDLDRRQAGDQPVYTQHIQPPTASHRKALMWIGLSFALALATSYGVLRYFGTSPTKPDSTAPSIVQAEPAAAPATIVDEASSVATAVESEAETIARAEPQSALTSEAPQPSAPVITSESSAPPAPRLPTPASAVAHAPATYETSPPIEEAVNEPRPDVRPVHIDVRPYRPAPTADGEYRRAAALTNQGRSQEARDALQAALALDPAHEAARQTLAVLLIEAGANGEAEALLAEGLRRNSAQTNFAIVLARLQLDRGDAAGALGILRDHAPAAVSNAEYRAFTAALLQRLDRHAEAIGEYRAVVALAPRAGIWWVGLGRSYEAAGRTTEAVDAYARARDTGALSGGVEQFVEQKLQTLR